jgi:hypothetical protein
MQKKMKTANLYKLLTREDPFHLHKALGIGCLLNFMVRFSLLAVYGNMYQDTPLGAYLVAMHGCLSVSSLIFHIPRDRNPAAPMIYPEFRLHSIVFGLRSVLCALSYYVGAPVFVPPLICVAAMLAADAVTATYGAGETGKTIRNMPFDDQTLISDRNEIIAMNSNMQIGATLLMLGNMDSAFAPLIGIQLAAFLMTLVRKGIIIATQWHQYYALSLWINVLAVYALPVRFLLIYGALYNLYTLGFFRLRMSKYINWSIVFALFGIYQTWIGPAIPEMAGIDGWIRHVIVAIFAVYQWPSARALFALQGGLGLGIEVFGIRI